jgi:hypothetical protein
VTRARWQRDRVLFLECEQVGSQRKKAVDLSMRMGCIMARRRCCIRPWWRCSTQLRFSAGAMAIVVALQDLER